MIIIIRTHPSHDITSQLNNLMCIFSCRKSYFITKLKPIPNQFIYILALLAKHNSNYCIAKVARDREGSRRKNNHHRVHYNLKPNSLAKTAPTWVGIQSTLILTTRNKKIGMIITGKTFDTCFWQMPTSCISKLVFCKLVRGKNNYHWFDSIL